ncbi:MAG TPA: SAV_6107 family HEPN domain-containing protein [Cellulomonas sp.]
MSVRTLPVRTSPIGAAQIRAPRAARGAAPGLSGRTAELLERADAELVAAQFSSEPWEQFTHAHLAALRAGAAVLADRQQASGRRAPRTVWELLDAVAPELGRWSTYFAAGAGLRAAVDAGRFDAVSSERAEQVLCHAEDFLDIVRSELESAAEPGLPVAARAG